MGSATSPAGEQTFEEHIKSREMSYLKGSHRRKARICLIIGESCFFFFPTNYQIKQLEGRHYLPLLYSWHTPCHLKVFSRVFKNSVLFISRLVHHKLPFVTGWLVLFTTSPVFRRNAATHIFKGGAQEVLDVPSLLQFSGRGNLDHGYSLGEMNRFSDLVTAMLGKLESVGPFAMLPNQCWGGQTN